MGIKVKRERPDQRRHHRVTAPLFVALNGMGEKIKAHDWSLGGLRVDGQPGRLPEPGEQVKLHLTLPFQGFDIAFDVEGRAVRNMPATGTYAVEFTKVGERETALMQHFIEDLVRGVMSPVGDSIQRLDVPVTVVSQTPDKLPSAAVAAGAKRLPVRQIAWVGVYALMGFVVFGYTALVLYSNVFRMEVQTAVIAAPTVEVPARGDGELPYIRVRAGDKVQAGDTVIYFTDFDLEHEIDVAKITIQEKEAALSNLQQKRVVQLEKMSDYSSIEVQDVEKIQVALDSLNDEKSIVSKKVGRLRKLLAEGLTLRSKVDDAEEALAGVTSRLAQKKLELKEQISLSEAGLGKRHYNGREFVDDIEDIDASIRMSRYNVALSNQAHEALLKHRERLAVKAPFNGRVLDVPVLENASVKRGDIIAVFEKDEERYVSAFLTQDEVVKVQRGEVASVYLPALNTSLSATVVSVDRTAGFKEEISRRFSWRGAEDRSAEVRLEFARGNDPELVAQVTSGLPAVVLFEAQSSNPILAAVWRKIGSLFL